MFDVICLVELMSYGWTFVKSADVVMTRR